MDVTVGAAGIKKMKSPENEDRLSALPDCLIHRILSFLPSTKQAIQTGILSKRWRNQWTFVSNLIFDFSNMFFDDSPQNIPHAISRIVDRTLFLHQCSKIQRFQIITDRFHDCEHDPSCARYIHYVVKKQAKELILKFSVRKYVWLPEFVFRQPSLVKLELFGCSFKPMGMVQWTSLKDLSIENCSCPSDQVITNIVSGSPLLQSLQVKDYRFCGLIRLAIASRCLKRLVVHHTNCYVDVSCPNLVEFDGCCLAFHYQNFGWCNKVLEKFLYDSPLLESLKLENFKFSIVWVASNVLKKFCFKGRISNEIAISCPNVEELSLSGRLKTLRLMNLSHSVCAFLDIKCRKRCKANVILESVQHLDELKFGNSFLESLSAPEIEAMSHPLLKCKSLTLEVSHGFHILGIAHALRSSPVLERLVLKLQHLKYLTDLSRSDDHSEENYWKSNETHFSYMVSHLRTVKTIGLSQNQYQPNCVLDFLEFILKNAGALERMVVILEDCQTDYVKKVSEKLLSFPRCSASVVDLVCPECLGMSKYAN